MKLDTGKQSFLSILKNVSEKISGDLSQLTQKRRLIVGEKDVLYVKAAQRYGNLFPNNKVKIIKDVGHKINKDQSEKIAREIVELEELNKK